MFDAITDALRKRTDLLGWTLREVTRRGSQLYAVPGAVESVRDVTEERYVIDVLRDTTAPGGQPSAGAGNVTLLPGADIDAAMAAAIDAASLHAGLVRNPPYGLPGPASLPDVPLLDEVLCRDMAGELAAAHQRLVDAVRGETGVRMTAAEFFAEEASVRLRNSRGIDVHQTGTSLEVEWVLLARKAGHEVETFVGMRRRRLADLNLQEVVAERAGWARDLLAAQAPPRHAGPVILAGSALAEFMDTGVIQNLGSAAARFSKSSTWEVGEPVFREPVRGDPLTVWANRQASYGVASDRFDAEGIPSQRLLLIDNNRLAAFSAGQRYAEYLRIPPTGEFGVIEVAAGRTAAASLREGNHVEIAAFSAFEADDVTGDFASEIRLGYTVTGGRRIPFKGGQLIGNYLSALADATWSRETDFHGIYLGPAAARFESLTVAP
jgi:predicted Zn-dependent protease